MEGLTVSGLVKVRQDLYARLGDDTVMPVADLLALRRAGYLPGPSEDDTEGTWRDWTDLESNLLKATVKCGEHVEEIREWFPGEYGEAVEEMEDPDDWTNA